MLTPVQRNTRDENKQIKEGETPPEWKEDTRTSKLRQKDTDAAWTQKRGKNFYGYKNHICADVKADIRNILMNYKRQRTGRKEFHINLDPWSVRRLRSNVNSE